MSDYNMSAACSAMGPGHCADWHVLSGGAPCCLLAVAIPGLGEFRISAQLHPPQAQHSACKLCSFTGSLLRCALKLCLVYKSILLQHGICSGQKIASVAVVVLDAGPYVAIGCCSDLLLRP